MKPRAVFNKTVSSKRGSLGGCLRDAFRPYRCKSIFLPHTAIYFTLSDSRFAMNCPVPPDWVMFRNRPFILCCRLLFFAKKVCAFSTDPVQLIVRIGDDGKLISGATGLGYFPTQAFQSRKEGCWLFVFLSPFIGFRVRGSSCL